MEQKVMFCLYAHWQILLQVPRSWRPSLLVVPPHLQVLPPLLVVVVVVAKLMPPRVSSFNTFSTVTLFATHEYYSRKSSCNNVEL
jgi:hypothetical protein